MFETTNQVIVKSNGDIDSLPIKHGGSFHGKLLVITTWLPIV